MQYVLRSSVTYHVYFATFNSWFIFKWLNTLGPNPADINLHSCMCLKRLLLLLLLKETWYVLPGVDQPNMNKARDCDLGLWLCVSLLCMQSLNCMYKSRAAIKGRKKSKIAGRPTRSFLYRCNLARMRVTRGLRPLLLVLSANFVYYLQRYLFAANLIVC